MKILEYASFVGGHLVPKPAQLCHKSLSNLCAEDWFTAYQVMNVPFRQHLPSREALIRFVALFSELPLGF